jgi:hypothetical protein
MRRVLFSVGLSIVSLLTFLPTARPCQPSPLHGTIVLSGTDGELPECIVTNNSYEATSWVVGWATVTIWNECDETFELEAIDDNCIDCTQLLSVLPGENGMLWAGPGSYVGAYQWALGETQGFAALEVETEQEGGGCIVEGPFGCHAYPVGHAPPFSSASLLLLLLLAGLILRKRPVRQA